MSGGKLKLNFNNKYIRKILHVMKITKKDVKDDYRESISKTNHNGIDSAVWARRSDELEKQFFDCPEIEILHIKRTAIWQFDPVFDTKNGTIFLLFSDKNLNRIRNTYLKKGKSSHYTLSFLLKNEGIFHKSEQLHFFSSNKEEIETEKERRKKDIQKMLGKNADNVKKVVMVSVTYINDTAIDAELLDYDSNFKLRESQNVSDLLNLTFSGDNNTNDMSDGIISHEDSQTNNQLVTLKQKKAKKDNKN